MIVLRSQCVVQLVAPRSWCQPAESVGRVRPQDPHRPRSATARPARRPGKAAGQQARIEFWQGTAYRAHLPAPARIGADPFGGASGQAITGGPGYTLANKTPRIAASTMDALLAWSLRMVEDFGPDITAACRQYRQLREGTHPSQRALAGLSPHQRIEQYVRQARASGATLPGRPGHGQPTVNYSHLTRLLAITTRTGKRSGGWPARWKKTITDSGLPIASHTYIGSITGLLGEQP